MNNNLEQHGGKVIASGGFGCIFKPALKCESQQLRNTQQISKLMTTKYANEEYNQIITIKQALQSIPNYDNYFLFDDITICKPDKLTKEDLKHYSKCKSLKKKGFRTNNINTSLDKLSVINMPNGGINVEKFVQRFFIPSNIIRLNNALIQLLVQGIVPMNNLNVYHGDVKDGNILVKITEIGLETRLIDWGLSFIRNSKEGIPKNIYRRPFQYNLPFSYILFNKEFETNYDRFLQINIQPTYFQLREFIVNYIFTWNKIRGSGHLSAINEIVEKLTIRNLHAIRKPKIKKHFIEYQFTYYYIVEYLTKILEKYTRNGKFYVMEYLNNVFLKNIDVWGFVMSYISIYEYIYDIFDSSNTNQVAIQNKLKYIITHFLYETPTTPIDIPSLTNELTSLNPILEQLTLIQTNGGEKTYKRKHSKPRKTRKNKKLT